MGGDEVVIAFLDANDADAAILAVSLQNHLQSVMPVGTGFESHTRRTNPVAQDFGSSLALILGSAAASTLAKGIYAWLRGHTGASMEIRTPEGSVIVRNADQRSLEKIANAFSNVRSR